MAYSMDLRKRVVAAAQSGESITLVGHRFSVVRATVRNGIARHHRGELSPGVPGAQAFGVIA